MTRPSLRGFPMTEATSTWRPPQIVRPIAIGIIWRDNELLAIAVRDDDGALIGWRPPGGTIEFGERAADALKRELIEELNEPITDPALLSVIENLYTHGGTAGHEVVFVFKAAFVDKAAYARAFRLQGRLADAGGEMDRSIPDRTRRSAAAAPGARGGACDRLLSLPRV
jgi:8-oxo-dGTP pyrophosphatase MutT (NUDIX family)